MAKVNVDKMANEILKNLEVYVNVTDEAVKEAVTWTAKETVKNIRRNAEAEYPPGTGKVTGAYAKSWAYKRDPTLKGKWKYSMVVYSKPPHYRLAHLLEKGHAKVNGGRVVGRPHIAPAEELVGRYLETRIRQNMTKEG